MPRDIEQNILDESQKSENRPIELCKIELNRLTLRLAHYPEDIEFLGETYQAASFEHGPISYNAELEASRTTIRIDNVALDMSSYIAHHNFQGGKLSLIKVFLDTEDEMIGGIESLFTGEIDDISVPERTVDFRVIGKLDILNKEVPGRTYGPDCPWRFGDENCGVEISEANNTKITGTIDSIDPENARIIELSEIVGDDEDYWAYGYIALLDEHGNIIHEETRTVLSSDSDGYVTVDMPFLIDPVGEDYRLIAGCDKTYGSPEEEEISGHGCQFWDNVEFFAGFLSIPEGEDVRT